MGDASVTVPDLEEWDKKTKLNFEREMLGLYVSDHPLCAVCSRFSRPCVKCPSRIWSIARQNDA